MLDAWVLVTLSLGTILELFVAYLTIREIAINVRRRLRRQEYFGGPWDDKP